MNIIHIVKLLRINKNTSPRFEQNILEIPHKNICGPGKSLTFGDDLNMTILEGGAKERDICLNSMASLEIGKRVIEMDLGTKCLKSKFMSREDNSVIILNKKSMKTCICPISGSHKNFYLKRETISLNNLNKAKSVKPMSKEINKIKLKGDPFDNECITITEFGYKSEYRNKLDGHVYFGFDKLYDKHNNSLNDIIITIKGYHPNPQKREDLRFMEIVYDKNTRNFILYFLNENLTLRCQIKSLYYIENYKPISFMLGKVPIVVKTSTINELYSIEITVFLNNKEYKYSFLQYVYYISLGRYNCNINIEDESVGEVHAYITFDDDLNHFFIKDNTYLNDTYIILHYGDKYIIDNKIDAECICLNSKFSIFT